MLTYLSIYPSIRIGTRQGRQTEARSIQCSKTREAIRERETDQSPSTTNEEDQTTQKEYGSSHIQILTQ